MSVLLINVVPQGIVFGADRTVTWIDRNTEELDENVLHLHTTIGYTKSAKVLRWQNRRALVGYVGWDSLGNEPVHDWLSDFIGSHFTFNSLEALANQLRDAVQDQWDADHHVVEDGDILVIELAGFEVRDGQMLPQIWHIANTHGLDEATGTYANVDNDFGVSDEFRSHFQNIAVANVRNQIETIANQIRPYAIWQTGDLSTFNTLRAGLDQWYRLLVNNFDFPVPETLRDWENQVRMKILTYGSYFEAFETPTNQIVGGGSDVLSLEWP